MIYITFQIKPTEYLKGMGYKKQKFAIECETEREAQDVCANLISLDGVSYIYYRKTKPRKDVTILSAKENYVKDIHL